MEWQRKSESIISQIAYRSMFPQTAPIDVFTDFANEGHPIGTIKPQDAFWQVAESSGKWTELRKQPVDVGVNRLPIAKTENPHSSK